MARNNPKVVYMEEAVTFIEGLSRSAGDKVYEVVRRIESGERNPVLFSKLEERTFGSSAYSTTG